MQFNPIFAFCRRPTPAFLHVANRFHGTCVREWRSVNSLGRTSKDSSSYQKRLSISLGFAMHKYANSASAHLGASPNRVRGAVSAHSGPEPALHPRFFRTQTSERSEMCGIFSMMTGKVYKGTWNVPQKHAIMRLVFRSGAASSGQHSTEQRRCENGRIFRGGFQDGLRV